MWVFDDWQKQGGNIPAKTTKNLGILDGFVSMICICLKKILCGTNVADSHGFVWIYIYRSCTVLLRPQTVSRIPNLA